MASNGIQIAPSSSSSSCSTQWIYEVFLSFRGETCNSFTDHLYHTLIEKEIITFKEDAELEWGNPISLDLFDAIKNSKIAVIILSKNYASSTWCLQELERLLNAWKKGWECCPFSILWIQVMCDIRRRLLQRPLLNMKKISRGTQRGSRFCRSGKLL